MTTIQKTLKQFEFDITDTGILFGVHEVSGDDEWVNFKIGDRIFEKIPPTEFPIKTFVNNYEITATKLENQMVDFEITDLTSNWFKLIPKEFEVIPDTTKPIYNGISFKISDIQVVPHKFKLYINDRQYIVRLNDDYVKVGDVGQIDNFKFIIIQDFFTRENPPSSNKIRVLLLPLIESSMNLVRLP